ncbi:FK506-binding protein 5-like [Mizuhopecten yessoensis]|uniref:Uncharacterized protein n=1 Tax=Mizuhopecten yessoensis TaxID=6573 RepID=A0A210QDL6_MIZYE|nr:FK506-binding protein 5-like [Mizuhopecten yessoensis]OWF46843.1 hypothetical protein KP79_PYT07087 [Mizuhopecten yessoensis]
MFSDDIGKFKKILKEDDDILKPYVPSRKVKRELNKISGRLKDCMYDDYRQRMDTPRSNVQIDTELAMLIAAEDDIKQSRRNFRRAVRMIVPSTGPSKEEKHELRELKKNPIRRMYELEDFMRDFDTMPFVATMLVDISLTRIESSIQRRQLALQNLRRVIYEASVTGYYVEAKVSKKARSRTLVKSSKHTSKTAERKSKHASDTTLETSKYTPETAVEKFKHVPGTEREKSKHASGVHNESDSDEDHPFTKVMEIYQAESLRLEKNLEMFNVRLQEYVHSHQSMREVKKVSVRSKRTRRADVKRVRFNIKTVMPEVKTTKPKVIKVTPETIETDKPIEKRVKREKPKDFNHKCRQQEFSEESDVTDVSHHDSQKESDVTDVSHHDSQEESEESDVTDVSHHGSQKESEESDVTDVSHHDSQKESNPPPDKEERTRKIISHPPREKTQTSGDNERADERVPKKKEETNGSVSMKSELSREGKDNAAKQKLVMQPWSDEEEEEESDDDFPQELPLQAMSPHGSDVEITKEPVTLATPTLGSDVEITKEPVTLATPTLGSDVEVTKEPVVLATPTLGSDVEVTKEPVILPLPTLDPMPVYLDNFQASCVLTYLFSSRDDFDEDFEPDYVIPPYESERTVYTGKQHKVYSRLNKETFGQKQRC